MKDYFNVSALKVTLKKFWKKISDINTFRGSVLVAVTAGVILLFVTFAWNMITSDIHHSPFDNTVSDDVASEHLPSSEAIPGNSITDNVTPSDAVSATITTDPPALSSSTPDDTISDNPAPSDAILNDAISNGTMPKGTIPTIIPITEEMTALLSSIQQLSIGCSKDWVNNKFGTPYSETKVSVTEDGILWPNADVSSKTGEILECTYIFEAFDALNIILVQVYFDVPGNSCKAFFVTLLEDTLGIDVVMPEVYSSLISNKSLGEFAYSEIHGIPDYVYGFTGQGVARTFYGEKYYFAASGNYQNFYFANLDYGMLRSLSEFVRFLSIIQFDINPQTDLVGLPPSDLLLYQRDKFYPNTFGISALNEHLTFSLLSSYSGFDSLPLRGWD